MNTPDAPGYRWTLARVVHATLAKLLLVLFRVRVLGRQNIPNGGAILAGNHVSYADPVLLWCASRRPTFFMAKAELWKVPVIGWALPRLRAFPVNRGEPDRTAIRRATGLLKDGKLVTIFPEGTRQRETDELGPAHGGVAFIALHAGVPVVPIGVAGTDRILPPGKRLMRFPRVTISYGPPISPVQYEEHERKQRVEAMTSDIMGAIGGQLEHAKGA